MSVLRESTRNRINFPSKFLAFCSRNEIWALLEYEGGPFNTQALGRRWGGGGGREGRSGAAMLPCSATSSQWGTGSLCGTLTGVLDCSVSFCSHIFSRLSRSLSSCSLKLRSRSSLFSLSRVASISHLCKDNWFRSQLCSRGIKCLVGSSECLIKEKGLTFVLLN